MTGLLAELSWLIPQVVSLTTSPQGPLCHEADGRPGISLVKPRGDEYVNHVYETYMVKSVPIMCPSLYNSGSICQLIHFEVHFAR